MELADGILDRAWLTNDGPLVRSTEEDRDPAASATAWRCATAPSRWKSPIRALGLEGEVIVPSSFDRTALAAGDPPVFADIVRHPQPLDPMPCGSGHAAHHQHHRRATWAAGARWKRCRPSRTSTGW